jgi:beta-N-acetylhexosaminidase
MNFIGYHQLIGKFIISMAAAVMLLTSCKSTEPAAPDITDSPDEQQIGLPLPELAPESQYIQKTKAGKRGEVDIDSLLQSMSLREKIGQLFFIPVNGTFRNARDQQLLEWQRLVTRYHIGGLIFMDGDIYGQAMMTQKMQELSKLPLWIAQDMEFGADMRVQGTTRFTPAMGIAATGKPGNAFLKGQITAREARALGVHQIYAPVLGVNNNPLNPVIDVRSFSSDPEMIARYGEAFLQGVESEGLLAAAKYIPGRGDTDIDTHLALPLIHHDDQQLESPEQTPLRIAINNELRRIMSANIAFPNIISSPETPGMLNPVFLNGILADTLGFDGLVVTDGLEMQGITSWYSPGNAVVRSIKAGTDVMLISPDEMTAIHEVEMAVKRGKLSEERIDRSVRNILKLKKEHGLFESTDIDLTLLSHLINAPEYRTAADHIARESITVLKNNRNILPVRDMDYQRIVLVSVADERSGSTGSDLASEMRKYHNDVTSHVLDQRTGKEEREKILEDAKNADLLVIGSFINTRPHQPVQLSASLHTFIQELGNLGKPSVLIAFGNPCVLNELKSIDVHMLAWSGSAHQVRNTVPALFGGQKVSGRVPATIPGLYEPGAGLDIPHSGLRYDFPESVGLRTDSLMTLDEVMQSAIEDSVFPGGSIAVVKDGVLAWHKGYGYHDYNKTRPVEASDVYDLASVTKVMATTTSIMKLYEQGKLNLDDPVSKYIPEFRVSGKRTITIRHLLLHNSGLPAYRVYVDELQTRSEIIQAIRNEPPENGAGTSYVYSDIGFILLGEIVEEVSGQRIDSFVRSNFFDPMGMYSAHYNPALLGQWMCSRIPPTEIDDFFGRGIVQCIVHDERAYFMDGIAGHAGLFGSAKDLAIWAQMILNKGYYTGKRYLEPETIELFTSQRSSINHRAYGFDRKSEEYSNAGLLTGKRFLEPDTIDLFTRHRSIRNSRVYRMDRNRIGNSSAGTLTGSRTFGHTGFTGTSIWIDPDNNLAIILLTNRSFPYRSYGREIRNIRLKIADTVMRSIID